MWSFRTTLDECHLQDLGFSRNTFTLCNGQNEEGSISERFDQFFVNKECQLQFPTWQVHHRITVYLDHSPILLSTIDETEEKRQQKLFHFEAMWTNTLKLFLPVWNTGAGRTTLPSVMNKINLCNMKLQVWNKKSFVLVRTRLQVVEKHLSNLVFSDPICMCQTKHKQAWTKVH